MTQGSTPEESSIGRGYQQQDAHLIDYELYQLPGIRGVFRGPPVSSDRYVACVGSAQTFGRFVETPYPKLISRALAIDALNLGRGGAGPTYPLGYPELLGYINRAQIVVVQLFSGRSQFNSLFHTLNHGMMGVNQADGREVSADVFYSWLQEQDEELIRKIVVETRTNYVQAMTDLLNAITAPKILFWFSVRTPDYQEQLRLSVHRLWGDFPHLVNREMVEQIRRHCDAYVECISRRGLPQRLSRRSGDATGVKESSSPPSADALMTENTYYPSPEMHEDAAALLIPVCRTILAHKRS
jgi:hypothetical protein